MNMAKASAGPKVVRCAIYTRKSTDEGLEQDFNSLHAQREACEAFIRSQHHEGWRVLPDGYSHKGKRYTNLSEIARTITGTRWSGPLFFGLKNGD